MSTYPLHDELGPAPGPSLLVGLLYRSLACIGLISAFLMLAVTELAEALHVAAPRRQ